MRGFKSLLLLTLALVAACGAGQNESETSEEYGYNLTSNGCSTEQQKFTSRDAYCSGLQDETRNKGCALKLRKETFQEQCQGRSWSLTNLAAVPCGAESCDPLQQYCLSSNSYGGGQLVAPTCHALPKDADARIIVSFEEVSAACDALIKDANTNVFPDTNNCRKSTSCGRKKGGGFYLDCYTGL
jgi:hypothetical protein